MKLKGVGKWRLGRTGSPGRSKSTCSPHRRNHHRPPASFPFDRLVEVLLVCFSKMCSVVRMRVWLCRGERGCRGRGRGDGRKGRLVIGNVEKGKLG